MVQDLFDNYIFLFIMGSLCAIGVLLKCFLLVVYNKLIRASESMAATKKSWMKHMKSRFENAYHQRIGVNDVDIFVDKYVSKTKYGGLLLSTWENISGQTISLCLLTGSVAGILGWVYDCGKGPVLFTFFMGIWTAVIVNIVDNIVNISGHRQVLRYNLKDYFENYLKVRLEQEIYRSQPVDKQRAGRKDTSINPKVVISDTYSSLEDDEAAATSSLTRKQRKEKKKMDALLGKMDQKKKREELKKEKEQNKLDLKANHKKKQFDAQKRKEELSAAKMKKKEKAKMDKLATKQKEKQDKADKKQVKADQKQARLDEKQAKIKQKELEREQSEAAKQQAKEAKKQAKLDAIEAKEREKEEARIALEESKKAMLADKKAKAELRKADKNKKPVSQKAQNEKMRLIQDKERLLEKSKKTTEQTIREVYTEKVNQEKADRTDKNTDAIKTDAVGASSRDPEDIEDFEPIEMVATSKEDDALIEEVLRDFLS